MKRPLRTILFMLFAVAIMQPIFAQLSVTVSFGPPALPVYDQPPCPGDGFLWTPGYWAYDDDDGYYWVPGTWVEAPEPGYLWTPAWWGWGGSGYLFHEGYWATDVGFYGGIYYGYGYFGDGFQGGRWQGDHFFYNRAVLNIDVTSVHNVYNTTVMNNVTANRVSYNGGEGGIMARPSAREQAVDQQRHIPAVQGQMRQVEVARSNPQMRAEANHGRPPVAASSRPGDFSGSGAVAARSEGAPYRPAPARSGSPAAGNERPEVPSGARPDQGNLPANRNDNANHARDLQPHQADVAPSSGNPRADMQYQKQQQRLVEQQNRDHQKLQQQQDKEDAQAAKYSSDTQRQQQVEQHHQQQTQQLEQKHTQQQQQLKSRKPPPKADPHRPE